MPKLRNTRDKYWNVGKLRDNTDFKSRWGCHAVDLAKQENVTPATIHMRVLNYGTPFQRRAKPGVCEQLTGLTKMQLAYDLKIHPVTVMQRIKNHGNPYYIGKNPHGKYRKYSHLQQKSVHPDVLPRMESNWPCSQIWLHYMHPDYTDWVTQKGIANEQLKQEARYYDYCLKLMQEGW